uniref:Redoxin domain-containing protein n=1 Tax=Schlesneria paludicola TaxID=360056 RepID=A0A7C2JYB6_9PLAN
MSRWGRHSSGKVEGGTAKPAFLLWVIGTLVLIGTSDAAAQNYSPQDLLVYKPKQPFVDYETPTAEQLPRCKVEKDARRLILLGPEGQILRQFLDANGDKATKVDQWRYYQHGLEVYREIDTNDNQKPDQFRWLNLGGSRWGIDDNEDGRIDRWKTLSAAEASREAILSMTAGDMASLQLLMVTADDLKALGVSPAVSQKVIESTSDVATKAQAILRKSKVLTPRAKWLRFDAQMPGSIPADDGKASQDLQVYEAAMAVIEVPGGKEPVTALVQIGEMIRVGEVWKLTQVPQPIEGEGVITSSGLLMQPLLTNSTADIQAPSPALQKVIEALQKLDANPPQFGTDKPEKLEEYNRRRADLLYEAYMLAEGAEEKSQLLKQYVDGLAAAVQIDTYPAGLARIKKIEGDIETTSPKSPLLAYITYRRIMSQYAVDMKAAEQGQQQKVQADWLESLSDFVKDYPDAEDVAEAMWQLATAEEFGGNQTAAVNWYQRLAKEKRGSLAANKAEGALRRLNLKGQPFVLTGSGLNGEGINTAAYRGKVLLVVYWASWSNLFISDLPQLRALHQQYKAKGFEVVGVCLDMPGGTRTQQVAAIQNFLKQNNVPWPQIFEPGGLDSPAAVQYGVIALPTMILVDQRGAVESRQATVAELKQLLPTLLK